MERWWIIVLWLIPGVLLAEGRSARIILDELVLGNVSDSTILLTELEDLGDPYIKEFVASWRIGEVYFHDSDGQRTVLHKITEQFRILSTDEVVVLSKAAEEQLSKARPSRKLRKQLRKITDTIDLVSPSEAVRIDAIWKLGLSGNAVYLPVLQERFDKEISTRVRKVYEEIFLLSTLSQEVDQETLLASVKRLGELKSARGRDVIETIQSDALETPGSEALVVECKNALRRIDNHQFLVNQLGNLFRGMSLGSVLLMVSFGLAITFGLMGIINMAHGEFIAIGGYTCYMVQNFFASSFGEQSAAYQWFFITSLPVSFIVAAVIGLGFEKTFIRFLYRRPLESLLATWGLSMVMQQVFRLIFGAANVQVNTPDFLMGSFELGGASLSFTRLFVIGFAGLVVVTTWLLLTKTNLGLFIRAVMQNRQMAASLGIPVERVNSITFSFGCGLASLAGAVLSQIGNVGPSMGQAYIVDSFMVVVAGSVGNLLGAGLSAMGIGIMDQFLQPSMGPVMGKITVFAIIILFLQWKPGGLFPTKSRSMED